MLTMLRQCVLLACRMGVKNHTLILLLLIFFQNLTRHLNEAKDALQFAYKTCDQLEQRVEDLEAQNNELKRACAGKESAITLKCKLIDSLQSHVEALRAEVTEIQDVAKHKHSTNNVDLDTTPNPLNSNSTNHSRGSPRPFTPPTSKVTASYSELQELTDELTLKLQNSSYQKSKLNVEVEKLLNENFRLQESLLKAENGIADLQAKVQNLEDSLADEGREDMPLSPVQSRGNRLTSTDSEIQLSLGTSSLTNLGTSLFSELNTQYYGLQKQLDSVLSNCTCGAAASLYSSELLSPKADQVEKNDCVEQPESSILERPLKDLFDEVFVTLHQSTLVVDRLMKGNTMSPLP